MAKLTSPRKIKLAAMVALTLFIEGCAKPNYLPQGSDPSRSGKPGGSRCSAETSSASLCIKLTWETFPTESQFGSFVFTLSDLATDRLDLTSPNPLSVILWMPSMGHGSSPVAVETIAPGIYRAKKVFFNMKGDWEIRFNAGDRQAVYALEI
jgi:hypothetical protein